MFEDVHKIDSTVLKPDYAQANPDKRNPSRKRKTGEGENSEQGMETARSDSGEAGTNSREHPLLDVRI